MMMDRRSGGGRGAMLALVALAALALTLALPRTAWADACEAGVLCLDEDHDGFAACGCAFSGTPCDCDDHDPTTYPGAPEACDSIKDHDCNGVTPDPCAASKGCFHGTCVPKCIPLDDFGCAVGSSFSTPPDGGACLCAPEDCTIFGCAPGFTCNDAKACVPTCEPGVRCPQGQVCRGFGCVDPCSTVTCPTGAVCDQGRCVSACTCQPGSAGCRAGEVCETSGSSPTCVEAACVNVRCPSGQHCAKGTCQDDCDGVVCPVLQVCRAVSVNGAPTHARCVDLCNPTPCQPGFVCQWRTGACTPRPLPEAGLASPSSLEDPLQVSGAGWLCTGAGVARASAVTGLASFGVLGMLVLRLRRRRRRGS